MEKELKDRLDIIEGKIDGLKSSKEGSPFNTGQAKKDEEARKQAAAAAASKAAKNAILLAGIDYSGVVIHEEAPYFATVRQFMESAGCLMGAGCHDLKVGAKGLTEYIWAHYAEADTFPVSIAEFIRDYPELFKGLE